MRASGRREGPCAEALEEVKAPSPQAGLVLQRRVGDFVKLSLSIFLEGRASAQLQLGQRERESLSAAMLSLESTQRSAVSYPFSSFSRDYRSPAAVTAEAVLDPRRQRRAREERRGKEKGKLRLHFASRRMYRAFCSCSSIEGTATTNLLLAHLAALDAGVVRELLVAAEACRWSTWSAVGSTGPATRARASRTHRAQSSCACRAVHPCADRLRDHWVS